MPDAQLESFLRVCREHGGGEPSEALGRATTAFVSRAVRDMHFLKTAVAALPSLAPAGAAWLAVAIGAAIEQGNGVEQTAPAIVDLFLSWLPRLPAPDGQDDWSAGSAERTGEQAALVEAFPQLCQSVVTHLARMPERRAELGQDMRLLDRLEELETYSHGAIWVREMLLRSSGLLIVLHQPSGKGFRLRYENVANCFHLFSLIQVAIGRRVPDGRAPDPAIAAAAKGGPGASLNDEAWWHYSDHLSRSAEIGASIWGESSVRSIPFVDGAQVIVLWPSLVGARSWDSGFFGPALEALPPDTVLEAELPAGDCRAWFDRFGIEPGKRRKSWLPW